LPLTVVEHAHLLVLCITIAFFLVRWHNGMVPKFGSDFIDLAFQIGITQELLFAITCTVKTNPVYTGSRLSRSLVEHGRLVQILNRVQTSLIFTASLPNR
jgi:hypothetical protein